MRVNPQGKVTRAQFFEGVMCSAARLTYTRWRRISPIRLQAPSAEVVAVGPQLMQLHARFQGAAAGARRSAARWISTRRSSKVRFDADGKIAALVESTRNDAHRLIEECMIAANVEAARFLKKHRMPTLYRVHGPPEDDRLETLRQIPARIRHSAADGSRSDAHAICERSCRRASPARKRI